MKGFISIKTHPRVKLQTDQTLDCRKVSRVQIQDNLAVVEEDQESLLKLAEHKKNVLYRWNEDLDGCLTTYSSENSIFSPPSHMPEKILNLETFCFCHKKDSPLEIDKKILFCFIGSKYFKNQFPI